MLSDLRLRLAVACQLALSPVRLFARWIEDALGVTVQRSHDADACEHLRAAQRRDPRSGLPSRLAIPLSRARPLEAGSDHRISATNRFP
jgi:hypothetical protein